MWISDIAPHFSLGTRLSVLSFTTRPLYTLRSAFNTGYYMARSEKRKIHFQKRSKSWWRFLGIFSRYYECYVQV